MRKVLALALLLMLTPPAAAEIDESGDWTEAEVAPEMVRTPSASPFVLADVGRRSTPSVSARIAFYRAPGASADAPAPAVILLHGGDGVQALREGRYAAELTGEGVHVAVVDVYAARDRNFTLDRLMNVTAMMAIADAYAALEWLAAQPEVDEDRVALIGFSFGGMAAMQAALEQVADKMAPDGLRFAAHVAYYAPCITRFEEQQTTGAPVLLMWGTRDDMVDGRACRRFASDLEAGGSQVEIERFGAAHNWDGTTRTRRLPSHVADCRLIVDDEGVARSAISGLPVRNVLGRNTFFSFCASLGGYLTEYDEAVRERSNRALARFLNPILFP